MSKHVLALPDRSNGSGMSGVTGLRASAGKSRMLGERISGLRGENPDRELLEELAAAKTGIKGLILRFFIEFLRSYSLNPDWFCFFGIMDFMGGIWVFDGGSGPVLLLLDKDACFAVSDDPVSIWTTCLNEEVSACTKVVGYGLADSDLVMGFGGWCWCGIDGGV